MFRVLPSPIILSFLLLPILFDAAMAATVTCSGPCNKPAVCDVCPQEGDTVNLTQTKTGGGTCTATLTVTQATSGSGGTVVGTASSSSGCTLGCANVDTDGTAIGFTAVWGGLLPTEGCFRIDGSVTTPGVIWFQVRDQSNAVLATSSSGAQVQPGYDPDAVRAVLDQKWIDDDIAFIEGDHSGEFCFFDAESRAFACYVSDDGASWLPVGPGSPVSLHGVTFSADSGTPVPTLTTGWMVTLFALFAVLGGTSLKRTSVWRRSRA